MGHQNGVPILSDTMSHLFRASGVCEIDFGLFREAIGRHRNRPSMEVGGCRNPQPVSVL